MNDSLLTMHLEAFVPIEIRELQRQGGPTDWHFEEAQRRFAQLREPEATESLMFPVSKKGLTGKMAGILVECLAVLAFIPGGVKFAGCHFEAVTEEAEVCS